MRKLVFILDLFILVGLSVFVFAGEYLEESRDGKILLVEEGGAYVLYIWPEFEGGDEPYITAGFMGGFANPEEQDKITSWSNNPLNRFPRVFEYDSLKNAYKIGEIPAYRSLEDYDEIFVTLNYEDEKEEYSIPISIVLGGCKQWNCLQKKVDSSCVSQHHKTCYQGGVYWMDSCNNAEELIEECKGRSCKNGVCAIEINPENEIKPIIISDVITEKELEENLYFCNGCELEEKCYPFGYRKSGNFCSDNGEFIEQLEEHSCENNFECKSNLCVSDECVDEGLFRKILNWFKKMFG